MLEPRFERNRVYYMLQRAQALLDGGDVEHAADEVGQAATMAERVHSDRVRGRLYDLRQQMRRYAGSVPQAADFLERTRQTGV